MESAATGLAAPQDPQKPGPSTGGLAPYLQRAALLRALRLRLAAVAPRLWPVENGLPLFLALDQARLLASHPRSAAPGSPRSRWEALAAHGCYSRQPNRTLRRSGWRARLRCGQENQGD